MNAHKMTDYKTESDERYHEFRKRFDRYKEKLDRGNNPEELREEAEEINKLYLNSMKRIRPHSIWWNKIHDKIGMIQRMSERKRLKSGLVGKVAGIVAITSLALSFLFFTPATTGFSVADLSEKTASMIAVIFFIIGIIASFVHFKNKI